MSGTGLVRMLCALSLLLVAFAHKPLASTDAGSNYADAEIASFVLPDGTLPEICLTNEDSGRHAAANPCEACRLSASVDLPSRLDIFAINLWFAAAELAVPEDARFIYPALRPGASPRGPPSFTA